MLTAVSICVEIAFKVIWEKEKPEDSEHDEKLKQDDPPQLPTPVWHRFKSIGIEMKYL